MVTKTNVKITNGSATVLSSSLSVKWQNFFWGVGWCELARTMHRLSTCYTIDEIIVNEIGCEISQKLLNLRK